MPPSWKWTRSMNTKYSKTIAKPNIILNQNRWYDATSWKWNQINEYQVFKDHGKAKYYPKSKQIINAPQGYQKIKVHLVAAHNLTPDPINIIKSGVVIFQKPNILLLDIETKNPTTLTYQDKNKIGLEQSMEMSKKKLQKTFPGH